MISGGEFGQPLWAVQRFHLPELCKDNGGAGRFELIDPSAEVQIAPLLVNRVALPRHGTKARFSVCKRSRQQRLQFTPLLFTNEVLLPNENHYVVVRETEFAIAPRTN